MHAIFFGVKQVHLGLLDLQRVLLAEDCEVTTTPARFDLMRVLDAYGGACWRWKVVRLLGVSGTVVSRMVKALEGEGLVERSRPEGDRRFVLVSLTARGQALVDRARGFVEYDERFEWIARNRFALSEDWRRESEIFREMLVRARVGARKRTPFEDPWTKERLFDGGGYYLLERPVGPSALDVFAARARRGEGEAVERPAA